ncbi:MAG TPA: POTRA domain-containing protein, partial [Pyrinomonadaceae bacterium]|nr:POTRA domain-containing protein [Pyrinomonadaceae bacterium]
GKIYSGKDVDRRARIIDFKSLTIPNEATAHDVHGTVIINAVLCHNGRVTDITVVQGLPFGVTENAISLVRDTQFSPAELNLHSVSQAKQFQFSVNDVSAITERIDPAAAAGRVVEDLDFIGYRRLTKEQIMGWILTRAGNTFNADLVQQDLKALLATGYFDSKNTRVTLEDGVRGGVRVVFEMIELPLIAEVRFEGLKLPDRSAVIKELTKQQVDVRKDQPLDSAKLRKAQTVIEQFFQSQGWINVKAEAVIENIGANEVKIVFKISGHNF